MKELDYIIKNYIEEKNTDYAVSITGNWGSGKTFYVKEHIFSMIRNLEYDNSLKYDPVYISLYGINNGTDFDKKIFVSINPFWDRKAGKIISNLSKTVLGRYSIPTDSSLDIMTEIVKLKNKVLCFDDLERLPPKLIENILGQINQFVEHDKHKVIIISDEDKIQKKALKRYHFIKEKLIRYTYKFSPSLSELYIPFVKTNSSSKNLEKIKGKKELILELFNKSKHNNLRTLNFLLRSLDRIFNELIIQNSYIEQIEDEITQFATIIAIELKKGEPFSKIIELEYLNDVDILTSGEILLPMSFENEAQEEEHKVKDYREIIGEKYLKSDGVRFVYFQSLVNFFFSGYLDINILNREVKEELKKLQSKELTKEAKTIKKISDFWNIEDSEIPELKKDLILLIKEGNLKLENYTRAWWFFVLLDSWEVEKQNFKELKSIFLSGLPKSKEKCKHEEFFYNIISNFDAKEPYDQDFNCIKEASINANKEIKENQIKKEADELFQLLSDEEISNFKKKLVEERDYFDIGILNSYDPNSFYEKIKTLKNKSIREVLFIIEYRYHFSNVFRKPIYDLEIDFWKNLKKLVDEDIKDDQRTIKANLFRGLSKRVDQLIKKSEGYYR